MTNDPIEVSEDEAVDVARAVMDFTAVDPSKAPLVRARLWRLRRSSWGWEKLLHLATQVASEEPDAAFWLAVKQEGKYVAILAALGGSLVIVAPESLKNTPAPRWARSADEAQRVIEGLALDDTKRLSSEREVAGGKLVEPAWPDVAILKEGELVTGSPFKDFRVEGHYYLPQSLRPELADAANALDRSLSFIVQKAYLKARDRIQKAPAAQHPDLLDTPKARVFLVFPSWIALEIERRARELDLSNSSVITTALVWGLPEVVNEK